MLYNFLQWEDFNSPVCDALSMSRDYRYSGRVGEHVASIITLAVAGLLNLTGVSFNIFHPIIAASRGSAVLI